MTKTVVVVGAGLMGLTTAYWLKRQGAKVTVIDSSSGAGLGTSFANGGMMTPSQANPWNSPGIFSYALSTFGKKDSPFSIKVGRLPAMVRWGSAFIANSREHPYLRNAERNFMLGQYSHGLMQKIEADLKGDYKSASSGTMQLFRDTHNLDGGFAVAQQLGAFGLKAERLDKQQLIALNPPLAKAEIDWAGGIFFPEDRSGDAYRFCVDLQQSLAAEGVEFNFDTKVTALQSENGKVTALETNRGPVVADAYVLATASYTGHLLKPLGVTVPIEPVKGLSVSVDIGQADNLAIPVVDTARKIAMTPFGDVLRIVGTAEFSGYDATIDPDRIATIINDATRIVPSVADIDPATMRTWAGLRPVTPTGFPVLGRVSSNLFLNAGHGPLGWTFAAGSGAIVADIVMGRDHALSGQKLAADLIRQ